eukprot:325028_1
MASRLKHKRRLNYNEPALDWEYKLDEPFVSWFGIQYNAGKRFKFQNMHQCFLLRILEFDIVDGIRRLICDIITKRGLVKRAIILKDDVPFEYWISAIRGHEQKLIENGWLSESEATKYKLNKNYKKLFY